jgi:prepilin-type N-terminal cleavage/methylation domain-containing protein
MAKNRRGFTLIEMVVVVLIMGILASIGMPYYYKTVETSKATDAVAIGHLLGNANRMYKIDNPVAVSGQITNGCSTTCTPGSNNACNLIACSYVAQQDWSNASYDYFVCNGGAGGGCCGGTSVACVSRKAGAPANYAGWGYQFQSDGRCVSLGSAPACPKF